MGSAVSSAGSNSCTGQAPGQTAAASDVIRRCNCYSSANHLSLDRRCYRHSLTFNHAADKTAINPRQKKKRSYGFATFKKRLIGKRRHCKGSDHGRYFRENFVDCQSDVLKALLGHYESLATLKDLHVQADLARPPAQTLGQSFDEIFVGQSCCDITLVHQGHRIPAHRSVLVARCPFFSRALAYHTDDEYHLRTRNQVSVDVVRAVIRYLYTGNASILASQPAEAIATLEDEFGTPNSLASDVAFLLDEANTMGDCRLVFGEGKVVPCHKTVLAARSAFFRRLIEKKPFADPMDIRLDEDVFPSRFADTVLNAMYLDNLDLGLAGGDESSSWRDAMGLYEIGRFIEFNFLAQGCEDVLMRCLSVANVNDILGWGLQAHGSPWMARQAYQFVEEEFFAVSNDATVLAGLSRDSMARLLKSDFVQASESEILQALIRWGEHQLTVGKTECRDTPTANVTTTLGRKAAKRREICDGELKDQLAGLLGMVRVPHVLSRDRASEVLDAALQRNLFPVLPDFASQTDARTKFSPWDPRCTNGMFARPRLFVPYVEECKKLIQDRCAQDPEIISSNSPYARTPANLYSTRTSGHGADIGEGDNLEFQSSKLPDKEIIGRMMERMKKLLNSASVQRALSSSFLDLNEVVNLVELRVVREYNLPDNYSSVLYKARCESLRSELQDRNRPPSSIQYHPARRGEDDGEYYDDDGACVLQRGPGPDVTLASSALSTLSLPNERESPDLVSVPYGATNIYADDEGRRPSLSHRQLMHAFKWPQPRSAQTAVRMSHSYCTGPSHMYL